MHILLTIKQTVELRVGSQLLAEKPEVDFLLRVAGTRQITEAVRGAGAKPWAETVLVVFARKNQ